MKQPSDVRQLLQRQFDRRHQEWLGGAGDWPLEVALGIPSEQFALGQLAATRAWVAEWQAWQDGAMLQWTERRWRTLGTQRLPELLRFDGPAQVAAWLGMGERWQRAILRRAQLADRWPPLAPRLGKHFSVLADYSDADFERLVAVTGWLAAHPDCGLYLRQLPVPGVDTKWIEARKLLLGELISSVTGRVEADLYSLCGLLRPPVLLRMRILDPALRARLGGIGDVSAPIDDLARLSLDPAHVLIVENLQTGLALADLPGAVAFLALGYGVDLLSRLPWVGAASCTYWGDIDTHGYAILSRARSHLPHLRSILMDEQTLLAYRPLWTTEPSQHGAHQLPHLHPAEQAVYDGLKTHAWADSLRFEQERICWPHAQAVLTAALSGT